MSPDPATKRPKNPANQQTKSQGKAVTNSLQRLGHRGIEVRQGKRFEITVVGEITDERLAEIREAAEKLLANTVIETFDVRVEDDPEPAAEPEPGEDGPGDAADGVAPQANDEEGEATVEVDAVQDDAVPAEDEA